MFLGKYGRHTGLPFLRPPLTTALLTLGKAHQVATLVSICVGTSSVCVCVCVSMGLLQLRLFSFPPQSAMLGNGLVLQNLLHMQLAQQQLLHIKDKRISSVRHLFVRVCVCVCVLE